MTDRAMTKDGAFDALMEHGAEFVVEISRVGGKSHPAPDSMSLGVILHDGDRFVVVEAGLDPDGTPCVTLSSFDESGEPVSPTVIDVGGSMMIVP